jgi:aldose 1-epimerase
MYELTKTPFGPHTRFTLHNPLSNTGFSIVPGAGANVLEIHFNGQNILDGYNTPEELEAGKWGKSTVLFPFPNRLDGGKYQWNGKEYIFPINNAATGNAIHGFVREEAFEPEFVFLGQDLASFRCYFDYHGERDYYPFPFALELEFTIHDSGKFEVQVEVTNAHNDVIPVGFGWHPYFRLASRADLHQMQLPAAEMVAINDRMIPTGQRTPYSDFLQKKVVGETALDNCFISTKTGNYQMVLEGEDQILKVKASASEFPFFQVFTPPHRESIALEPMSCNVDAFNNLDGLISLPADGVWNGKMSITWTDRPE